VFRHLIRNLRGPDEVQIPPDFDWSNRRSKVWQQIRENPRIPFNLNVMLEGMSMKNNRERLLEQINENEPTVNPKITLHTLEKFLQLFKDQFESTQKNVLNSIGKLPINEEQILTSKYPRKRAYALKRDLTRVTVSSRTNTMDRQLELEEYEHTVVE
jgi:hypothetical protein